MDVKYNLRNKSNEYIFADVEVGQVFRIGETLMMRIETTKTKVHNFRCVELKTGQLYTISDNAIVILIDGSYTVRGMKEFKDNV